MFDHRKLGRELDLFDSDPLIGAGLPFWLPAGAAARYEVESYIREAERRAGYQHVYSPVIGKRELYERSGHWQHFRDDMFPPMAISDDDQFLLRPSLCPHHALIYKSRPRSYRDLPLRIAETGPMYRAERSGVLGGLSRVRSIWLNDAHNFCALDQIGDEIAEILALIESSHRDLGVTTAGFRLSLPSAEESLSSAEKPRPSAGESLPSAEKPRPSAGESLPSGGGQLPGAGEPSPSAGEMDQAANLLRAALDHTGVSYVEVPGEAAFYGPKIDVQIVDPAGRESTLATIQIDFHQPEQFDLSYVDSDGSRKRPVMVHRSIIGSMERLFAYLIEAHGGAFPVWYAPVQVLAVPVSPDQDGAAISFARRCVQAGLRAERSLDGSLGARIRDAIGRRIPYVAVLGAREAASGEVSLRLRDGRRLPVLSEQEAVRLVSDVSASRSHALTLER